MCLWVCLCIPLTLLDSKSVTTFPRQRRIVGGVILCAVRVVLKVIRLFVTPNFPVERTSVSEEHAAFIVSIDGLMMEAGSSFETSITVSQTTGRHISEETNLHNFHLENFQSRSLYISAAACSTKLETQTRSVAIYTKTPARKPVNQVIHSILLLDYKPAVPKYVQDNISSWNCRYSFDQAPNTVELSQTNLEEYSRSFGNPL